MAFVGHEDGSDVMDARRQVAAGETPDPDHHGR